MKMQLSALFIIISICNSCYFTADRNNPNDPLASSYFNSENSSIPVATEITASSGDTEISIKWTPASGIARYNIYWSASSGVSKANSTKISGVTSPYLHTGLTNGTTYYYIVTSVSGTYESPISFEVSATPMTGATLPVTENTTSVTDTSVSFNGSLKNPAGYTTDAWFEYGLTTAYGSTSSTTTYASGGNTSVTISQSALQQNTLYHYRFVTQNSAGIFYGSDRTMTTVRTVLELAVSGITHPRYLAIDASNVYWTETDFNSASTATGYIKKVSIAGGAVTTLATITSSALNNPNGIAIDADYVYWTDTIGGSVNKVSKNGGAVTILDSGLSSPQFAAVDSTSLYWTESTSLKKISVNGGAVTTLASDLGYPQCLAVDSSYVYWTEYNGGTVKKIAINGGSPIILASGQYHPFGIAIDSANVYWTQSADPWIGSAGCAWVAYSYPDGYMADAKIQKVSKNGGEITLLASTSTLVNASDRGNLQGIAVYSDYVYWVDDYRQTLSKVGINGGAVTTIISGTSYLNPAISVVVDSTSVYSTSRLFKADR